MHLEWRKAIFHNLFTRLKYIICGPLLSLVMFLKITLARITPHTGGKCKRQKKPQWLKVSKQHWGHKKKFSIIKSVQTKLGAWRKKNQRVQKNWASHKNNWYDDAQPSEERKKQMKNPSPTLRGTIDHFGKTFKW